MNCKPIYDFKYEKILKIILINIFLRKSQIECANVHSVVAGGATFVEPAQVYHKDISVVDFGVVRQTHSHHKDKNAVKHV